MHWRRKWQPTPMFLPGESQGQGSLVGCGLWGRTESDMTGATYLPIHVFVTWPGGCVLVVCLCCTGLPWSMDCSTPGLPVHHQLPEFTRLTSIESVMPSSHLILCRPLLLLPPIPPSISQGTCLCGKPQPEGREAACKVIPMGLISVCPASPLTWNKTGRRLHPFFDE